MKKILKVVSLVAACIVLASCGSSNGDRNNETAQSPKTIMESFEGDRRLWYLTARASRRDALSYNSAIKAVYVIEDKQVTEMYYSYNLTVPFDSFSLDEKTLYLEDLNGLNDEEILELVRKEYKDVTQNYLFYKRSEELRMTVAWSLPYEIHYNGTRDNSGNIYTDETIYLLPSEEDLHYKEQQTNEGKVIKPYKNLGHEQNEFVCKRLLQSIQILDKKYVGYEGNSECFITADTYKSFDVRFDDPAGGKYRP